MMAIKKNKYFTHSVIAILIFICCHGLESCSSSEVTTEQPMEDEQISSEQNSIHQDTVKAQVVAPVQPPQQQVIKQPIKEKINQGFVTQYDTIEVQSEKKHISGNTIAKTPIQRLQSKKKYFTIQIGAFKVSENAERAEILFRNRYDSPTSQFFDTSIKMNRVFGGIFTVKKDAFDFLARMKNDFPAEYNQAWVAERTQ